MSSEHNAYDSGFERANHPATVGQENLGRFPNLKDINDKTMMLVGYVGKGRHPVWLKSTNEIFMMDSNKQTYPVRPEDKKIVDEFIDFQKIFQLRHENDPEASQRLASARVVTS